MGTYELAIGYLSAGHGLAMGGLPAIYGLAIYGLAMGWPWACHGLAMGGLSAIYGQAIYGLAMGWLSAHLLLIQMTIVFK